jgi:hypothetical protein
MRNNAQVFFYLFCALLRNQFGEVEEETQMGTELIAEESEFRSRIKLCNLIYIKSDKKNGHFWPLRACF